MVFQLLFSMVVVGYAFKSFFVMVIKTVYKAEKSLWLTAVYFPSYIPKLLIIPEDFVYY